jgi:hypothetical protein
LVCPIDSGSLVFIFINFQETFNFLFYFSDDPLIVEQCVVQLPVVCIFSGVVFGVKF